MEAEGLVSIKLRIKEQRSIMQRLDPEIARINAEPPSEDKMARLKAREELLAPIYHTVAVHFADLHDTPVRMKEKSVIRDIIPWKEARVRLYWRLKRRLLEAKLKNEIPDQTLGHGQKTEMIRRWFIEDRGDRTLWEQDGQVVEWLQNQVNQSRREKVVRDNVKAVKRDQIVRQFRSLVEEMSPDDLHEAGIHLVHKLTPTKRQEFINSVNDVLNVHSEEEGQEEEEEKTTIATDYSDNSES